MNKDTDKQEVNYGLFIRFPDQSKTFTNGFEAGMVYQKMSNKEVIDQPLHTDNIELYEIMAKKMHYKLEYSEIDGDGDYSMWRNVTLKPVILKVIT